MFDLQHEATLHVDPPLRHAPRPEASREREVSVLFADLRDFTGYTASHAPSEVFAFVRRYARTLQQIVRAHEGEVTDFSGDGLMAIFGAREELAGKERAAIESGREICEIVGGLERRSGGGPRPSAGVGIATGNAYLGGIRAGNHVFWTAVGDVTNLAARLERLTRDLHASLAIDARTWSRGGPAAEGFERRPLVPIRGRPDPQDVYALRMGHLQ
jgi:class 3 adenylate cyclase